MQVPLKETYYKSVLLRVCGLLISLFFLEVIWLSSKATIADLAYKKNTLGSLNKAVELAPGNVIYRALLAEQLEGLDQDPKAQLLEITRLDPLESQYWIRLALREEIEGKYDNAESHLLKAAEIDRKATPRWALMNFYFRRDRQTDFWSWLTRVLEINLQDASAVFRLAWDRSSDSAFIFSHIPDRTAIFNQYLLYLLPSGRWEEATDVARRVAQTATPGERPLLLAYCEHFCFTDSARVLPVWNALCRRKLLPYMALDPSNGSILTNANFLETPTQSGFDWRVRFNDGILVSLNAGTGVRIEFEGNQIEDTVLLSQVIPLSPGRKYQISWNSEVEGTDSVNGLNWNLIQAGSDSPAQSAVIAGAPGASKGIFAFAATQTSGRLQLRYRRPLGSVRAKGTVTVNGLSAGILP